MCGICGIVDYDAQAQDHLRRLPGMVASLAHRGPDQSGTWAEDRAGLGHARLSIIDLSEDGRQPMSNEDGAVRISFNGEIFNFQQLRQEMQAKGHRFRSRTDTEAIVHLYEQYGADCAAHLRGMFAFAIWDSRKGQLLLVRDRLGIKPLYYTIQGGRLIFASEIKAILACGDVPRSLRPDALSDYLTFLYVPTPKTMFRDIFKLPAGHFLKFDRRGAVVSQYWDLPEDPPLKAPRPQIEQQLIETLSQAVKLRLVSDVPLGAFLSGGVDSSAVVAMMARCGQDPLITASIGFDEDAYNELPHARRVAQQYKTRHYEHVVTPDAVSIVDKLAWHYDEPFADYSAIPTYYVSQAARRHVTVALSGDGGDENFAGYRRYWLDMLERRLRRCIPPALRRIAVGPLAWAYPKADWLPRPLRAKVTLENVATDAASAYCRSVGFLGHAQKMALFTDGLRHALGGYRSSDIIRAHMNKANRDDLSRLLYTDIKTYLVDDILTKVDRASMAVSLEVRVPLLDHVFVELAHRVPASMKLRGRNGKDIFKTALRPYLDEQTLYRPKQGFTPPLRQWLRGSLREMVGDRLASPNAAYAEFLDRRAIMRAWSAHQSRLSDQTPLLWAVLMLELWAEKFISRTASGPRPSAGVARSSVA